MVINLLINAMFREQIIICFSYQFIYLIMWIVIINSILIHSFYYNSASFQDYVFYPALRKFTALNNFI